MKQNSPQIWKADMKNENMNHYTRCFQKHGLIFEQRNQWTNDIDSVHTKFHRQKSEAVAQSKS